MNLHILQLIKKLKNIFDMAISKKYSSRRIHTSQLRAKLKKLLNTALSNEKKLEKLQRKELKLIKLESLSHLINEATMKHEVDYDLDIVTLGIVDSNSELDEILALEGKTPKDFERLIIVDNSSAYLNLFKDNRKPIVGLYKRNQYSWLFPVNEDSLASIAIIPLIRRGKFLGSLNLGSNKSSRFNSSHGTHLIERLAAILSVCLENIFYFSRVSKNAVKDSLTGLWNRRFFDEDSSRDVKYCLRKYPFSILMIDIDKFKTINDSYGHDFGDLVIKEVANISNQILSKYGKLCRFGGEEFVSWFSKRDNSESFAIAEEVRRKIESHLFTKNAKTPSIRVTVSIGVSTLLPNTPCEENTIIETMVKKADEYLYQAKTSGRNKVIQNEIE